MEFGLAEDSSLVRPKSPLVARDILQNARMTTPSTAYAERNIIETSFRRRLSHGVRMCII